MARMKTFFIYFLLVVLLFIFSQVIIYICLNTTYKYKEVESKTTIPVRMELQATSINGFAAGQIINNTDKSITNKYLKIECYSKNNILMGTKYIEIDEIKAKEEKKFEVHFNFNKVEKAVIDIVDAKDANISIENMKSDPIRGVLEKMSALISEIFSKLETEK